MAGRTINALMVWAIVAAATAVFDVAVSPHAAVADAGGGARGIARVAHAGIVGAGAVTTAWRGGGASGRWLALCEAPRRVGCVGDGGGRPAAAALLTLRFVYAYDRVRGKR